VTAGRRAMAAAAGAIAIWSLNATAGGAVLAELSVLQVLALEFGGAFVVLAIVRAIHRGGGRAAWTRGPRRARAVTIGVVGITGTIALQYLAFATAPLVAANAIAYAWPLLAAAWTALAPGGDRSRSAVLFALAGFAGLILLLAARESPDGSAHAPLLGYVAAIGSAVAMASYTLTAGRSGAATSDLLLAGTGAGALGFVPVALAEGAAWSPLWAIGLSVGIGIAMLAVGYGLWTHAMGHSAGARLAPAAYVTPLLSTGLLLATGERLSSIGLIGCALIVLCAAGVVLPTVLRPDPRRSAAAALSRPRATR